VLEFACTSKNKKAKTHKEIYQMINIKSVARRGTSLVAALSLLSGIGTSLAPVMVHADALNPLTERSLTLSSSSPGWAYKDGSGNSTYAYPNSGTNGKKSANYFSFKPSTTGTIYAMTFQYCTTSAGNCLAPGDDGWTGATRNSDVDPTGNGYGKSDLSIHTSTPTAISSSDWTTIAARGEPDPGDVGFGTEHAGIPLADDSEGNFVVLTNTTNGSGGTWEDNWDMTASNIENGTVAANTATGKVNTITLKNSTGMSVTAGQEMTVKFFATDGNYITNPGSGAFFVKINTFSSVDYQNWDTGYPTATTDCDTDGTTFIGTGTGTDQCKSDVIDGGVTVANVMNESIAIQTKVLETMQFSVGTIDPDSLSDAQLAVAGPARSTCNPILPSMDPTDSELPRNTLTLGDPNAEDSLSTDHTYATHSFFRLSSNSSNGATVYYSGITLSNTEGDQIDPIGTTKDQPRIGKEQFGLALDNGTATDYSVSYALGLDTDGDGNGIPLETGADINIPDRSGLPGAYAKAAGYTTTSPEDGSGLSDDFQTYQAANSDGVHLPKLAPLVPTTNFNEGTGGVNAIAGGPTESVGTKFAFDNGSNSVPQAVATENSQVVDCVTGKVKYIANIAATTPAGIYTTKINYIAAPQY
jgi:hypothetical protein